MDPSSNVEGGTSEPEPPSPPVPGWVLLLLIPGTLIGYLSVQGSVQLMSLAVGLCFSEVFVFLAVPWLLSRMRHEDPLDEAKARWPGWQPAAWGAALGAANFFAAAVPLNFVARRLFPQDVIDLFDMSHLFDRQQLGDLALILVAVSLLAPYCEEFFFRGFLQERLSQVARAPWPVVVFVAFVFSAFHLDPVGFLARFELGLLFGLLYWKFGSLWPSVMAHAANNTVSTILFLIARAQGEEEEDPDGWIVLAMAAVGIAVMAALLRSALRIAPHVRRPAPRPPSPPKPSDIWPWPVAGLVALAAVFALDFRGVRLNVVDAQLPLPTEHSDADEHEEKLRDELFETRVRARRGEVPIEEYERQRKEARDLLRLQDRAPAEDT